MLEPEPQTPVPLWKRGLKSRRVQLVLGLVLLCLGTYWYFFSWQGGSTKRTGEEIAKLTFLRNKVEIRYGGSFNFLRAVPDMSLLNDDAVKTHEKSAAMLEFGPQSFMKVSENGLVIVRKPHDTKELMVEVSRGEVEATLAQTTTVKTPNGELKVEPGAMGIARFEADLDRNGAGEVRLLEGDSKIQVEDKFIEMKAGDAVLLSTDKIASVAPSSVPIVVGPPDRGTISMTPQGDEKLAFRFGDPKKEYQIEISKDPRFVDVVSAETVKGGAYEKSLAEGTYYWRVAEVKENGKRGAFTASKRVSLELPRDSVSSLGQIGVRTETPSMVIVDGANRIRVVRGGKDISGAEVREILAGDRLQASGEGISTLTMGRSQQVQMMEKTNLYVADLGKDVRGEMNPRLQLESGAVLLRLKEGMNAKNPASVIVNGKAYQFSSQEGGEVLLTREASGETQVRVLSGKVQLGQGKEMASLAADSTAKIITAGGVEISKEKEDLVDIVLQEGVPSNVFYSSGLTLVAFEWKSRDAGRTIFELANDIDFRRIVHRQTVTSNRATTAIPSNGNFFWRYRINDFVSPGTQIGFYPGKDARTGSYKVVIQNADEKVVFGSQPPVLTFLWEAVPGIEKYRLEMFRDREAKSKIYEKEVAGEKEITFFADFLGEGDYFWRTVAIDHAGNEVKTSSAKHIRMDRNPLAPMVDISYPEDTYTTSDPLIIARGMLFSSGELSVNGQVLRKGTPGPFSVRLDLRKGLNPIVFKEVSPEQRVSYYLRKVVVDSSEKGAP